MYVPPAFREDDLPSIHRAMRDARLANLVTATSDGMMATPLPMLIDDREGDKGTLYGHVARANPQWKAAPTGEALAIFMGPDAYITPSWYVTKHETGKVVPTWNYATVQVRGRPRAVEDPAWLVRQVAALTDGQEAAFAAPWAVSDAPEPYIAGQLKGIIYEELLNLSENGPSQEDLSKTVENLLKVRQQNKEHNSYVLGTLFNYYLYGINFDDPSNYEDVLNGLTRADVQKVMSILYADPNLVDVVFIPKEAAMP